jgi:hypothetical protein
MAHFLFDPEPADIRIKLQNEAISHESLRTIALKMIRKTFVRLDYQSKNRLKYNKELLEEFQTPAFLEFIGETTDEDNDEDIEDEDEEMNKKPPAVNKIATLVSPDKRKPPPLYTTNPYSRKQPKTATTTTNTQVAVSPFKTTTKQQPTTIQYKKANIKKTLSQRTKTLKTTSTRQRTTNPEMEKKTRKTWLN